MSFLNGRLPDAALAPIAGGRLRRDAARAWNAMNAESLDRFGVTLRPTGPASSYRTYAQQVYLWNNCGHPHDTNWVAVPGTSNHGWGLAVDLATPRMREIVNEIGAQYGYQKQWSDAPGEWWHIKFRTGVWNGKSAYGLPTLKRGSIGPSVLKLKRLMRKRGLQHFNAFNPFFSLATESAIKRFQARHHLGADGVVGPATWKALGA